MKNGKQPYIKTKKTCTETSEMKITRDIFSSDSLRALWFVYVLIHFQMPLTVGTIYGFKIKMHHNTQ